MSYAAPTPSNSGNVGPEPTISADVVNPAAQQAFWDCYEKMVEAMSDQLTLDPEIQKVYKALEGIISGIQETRLHAEKCLQEMALQSEHGLLLLRMLFYLLSGVKCVTITHLVCVWLKKWISASWEGQGRWANEVFGDNTSKDAYPILSRKQKKEIKGKVLELMSSFYFHEMDSKVRTALCGVIVAIAEYEWSDQWKQPTTDLAIEGYAEGHK